MPDVDMWLEELGLSEYVAAFKDNAIGFDQLTGLDHDILKDIGVNAVGHRMKILAAAEKIGEPSKLLASTDKKAVQQAKQASEREPEHRQVTVLFADIAEYTPLAEKLGAEKTFELIQSVLKEMIDAVESHGGTIQDIAGDAVLALFGAPTAIEDATLLACKSALDMQNRMAELADRFNTEYRVSPSLRIGIHIGPVVVGEIGAETRTQRKAVGDTVNMASRLETAAEPGTVLISEPTYKLVEGRVESAFAGERQFKGKAEAQRVYRLVGLKSGVSRFDAVASRGLTPMVEREVELGTLSRCWNQACLSG